MANNETRKIDYYKNGNKYCEEYYINGEFHREDGPAIICYYDNGNIYNEKYYTNNKLHREDGPAVTYYYENGIIQYEKYYYNDKLHREDGPAIIKHYNNGSIKYEEYYINGKFVMTDEEVEKYINSAKPIKVRNINKLKILYNICKARNLEDKMNEIGRKLLLKTLQK